MKKETIADKLARKSFESAAFQKSWRTHMAAFGPILVPAFPEDYQAKVHLAAALNKISSRDIKGGLDKLKVVQKYCQTNADKAAWCFFMGLCCEMAGATDQMIMMYQEADRFGHRFYMPYLKVAKQAYNDGALDVAEENYRDGIACFDATGLDDPSKAILGSAYTNLASCLTMMHRYDDAAAALETSKQLMPQIPGRTAAEAVLAAAMGQAELTAQLLDGVEASVQKATRQITEDILNRNHPHFHKVEIDEEQLAVFWAWFAAEEASLLTNLRAKAYETVLTKICSELQPLTPFQSRSPELGIEPGEEKFRILLADFYSVALHQTYEALLATMPGELEKNWMFEIRH